MAEVGELLGLEGGRVTVGVTDGVVALGVGVEGVTGGLFGEAAGVVGDGLPAELGEGTAGELTGDAGLVGAGLPAELGEGTAGELTGDAGVVGAGLAAELSEGTAGELTGDDGAAGCAGAAGVVGDGEVTGDAGTVVLKDGTKPGHLPQVTCNTQPDQLSIIDSCKPAQSFLVYT